MEKDEKEKKGRALLPDNLGQKMPRLKIQTPFQEGATSTASRTTARVLTGPGSAGAPKGTSIPRNGASGLGCGTDQACVRIPLRAQQVFGFTTISSAASAEEAAWGPGGGVWGRPVAACGSARAPQPIGRQRGAQGESSRAGREAAGSDRPQQGAGRRPRQESGPPARRRPRRLGPSTALLASPR